MLRDPANTIDFDPDLDRQIQGRSASLGADGKLLPGPDGAPYRVNLAEKLLICVLARLFNYIPEAGVWMNTQRPEWNDANNALVGNGVSVVTLCYLRRFVAFCAEAVSSDASSRASRCRRRWPMLSGRWRARWTATRVRWRPDLGPRAQEGARCPGRGGQRLSAAAVHGGILG